MLGAANHGPADHSDADANDVRRCGADPQDSLGPVPEAVHTVFGDRSDLAVAYAESLATEGIERGLIGPREIPRIWERHVLNSAALAEVIPEGARVVDIGSGAGLPGIPLAIARPDVHVQLVEPLLRRTTYLSLIVARLGLHTEVVRGRAEEKDVLRAVGGADIVTSRAVAPLGKLVGWSLPLVRVGGHMKALKGSTVSEELQRDAKAIAAAGAGEAEILTVGEGVLEQPTNVVVLPRVR